MTATEEPPKPPPGQTEAAARIYAASLTLRTAYRRIARATGAMEAAIIAGMEAGIPPGDIPGLTAEMDDNASGSGLSVIIRRARANYRQRMG